MNRSLQSPFDAETFLPHARKVKSINRETEEIISGRVADCLHRYVENWPDAFERESSRLMRITDGINRALAAMIAKSWTFSQDESPPFHDEDSAFAWLTSEGKEPIPIGGYDDYTFGGGTDELFEFERDWTMHNLWEVRKAFEREHLDLLEWNKFRKNDPLSRPPKSAVRLPADVQELIHDLCQIWHDHIDRQLGLPSRSPRPSNPLLRFIGACLTIALGDQRPADKTVLDFILKRSRPTIRRRDAKYERRFDY
ncbi:hypothetical protein [Phyllobacterium sp. UNC302MFCol5.2]|uniref:hypothetical protein n=1 Tax=Phyllobacterium sp. UNC302MFCol5.2 TaxID=1449065 RepID=UPI00048291C7|nr:hypothetical protein [Phyllobacterium sp. UNC302MFCol5.2]